MVSEPWTLAGTGLLIPVLELNWLKKSGAIDVKLMILFMKKNHLLENGIIFLL